MIRNNKNKAFTFVELMITVTIIVFLLLTWLISFVSYLTTTRDFNRVMDFKNIESIMYSYSLKNWFFPNPSNPVDIFYSGWLVWTQWTYTNETSNIIWYSNNIRDPLTMNLYTYSVKNSRKEFSLAWVLEKKQSLAFNDWIVSNTYAEEIWVIKWIALIIWNYNWELLSVKTGSTDYILALPSIVATDLSSNDLIDIINSNKLVYNNYENLPFSYSWSRYNLDANIDFSANDLVIFSWSINELKQTTNQVTLLQNLYNSYSWTIIWANLPITKISSVELFNPSPSTEIKSIACDIINFKLKFFTECDLYN